MSKIWSLMEVGDIWFFRFSDIKIWPIFLVVKGWTIAKKKMGIFVQSMLHAEVLSFLLAVDRPLMKSMEMSLQLWIRIGNGYKRLVRYWLWCLFLVYLTFSYKLLDILLCSFPINHPRYFVACYDLWTYLSVLWLIIKFQRLVVSLHAWHEWKLPFFSIIL